MSLIHKLLIQVDDADVGVIWRLYADGVIKKITTVGMIESQTSQKPQEFARAVRSGNFHPTESRARSGLRAVELLIGEMQSRPDASWQIDELKNAMVAHYDVKPGNVSPGLSELQHYGYVERVGVGQWKLTDQGKSHPQNDPLPFQIGKYQNNQLNGVG